MVDTHAHLTFESYGLDSEKITKEAFEIGLDYIVTVGTQISSSQDAVKLAEKFPNLYASVGIHPHHADKLEENWEKKLEALAQNPKVVSIGECGMDFYSYSTNSVVDEALQRQVFEKQIIIAKKLKLPLQIHNRQAEKVLIEIIKDNKNNLNNHPGMIHCFSGSMVFLKKVLDLGFYIGFDGNITYDGIAKGDVTDLKDLVKYAPTDRILTETDSPYLSPMPYRGLRNTPKNVIIVQEFISKLKSIDNQKFGETVLQNFRTLFKVK